MTFERADGKAVKPAPAKAASAKPAVTKAVVTKRTAAGEIDAAEAVRVQEEAGLPALPKECIWLKRRPLKPFGS